MALCSVMLGTAPWEGGAPGRERLGGKARRQDPGAEWMQRGLWLLSLEPPSLAGWRGRGSDLHFERPSRAELGEIEGGRVQTQGPGRGVVRAGWLREASRVTLCPGQSPESVCVQGKLRLHPVSRMCPLELRPPAQRPLLSPGLRVCGNTVARVLLS